MSTGASTDERARALLVGAIDTYIHAEPDLLPRRTDDVELARDAAAAGFSAIVHRNHYSSTAERCTIVRELTGFPILGAITLHDALGGINPWAVDLALQMGAVWVGFPTLSARWHRARRAHGTGAIAAAMTLGPGDLSLLDDEGRVSPDARAVIELTLDAGVVLHLGFVGYPEILAAARAAAELGHDKLVITDPFTKTGLTPEQLDDLLAVPNLFVEVTSNQIHPTGPLADTPGIATNVELIRHVGLDRVVLTSDGGQAGTPPPAEILTWALERYLDAGFTDAELDALVRVNPRRLLPTVD